MRMKLWLPVIVAAVGLVAGCTSYTPSATPESGGSATPPPVVSTEPVIPDSMHPGEDPGPGENLAAQPEAPQPESFQPPKGASPAAADPGVPPGLIPAGQPDEDTTRVKAQVGVGKQGKSLEGETGIASIIVQPARTLFAFKQRAVFEIEIPSAMKLFEATNGRKPNSNDEFMSQIVKFNNIKLPELPAGQRYEYDPKLGELMVIMPKG